MQALSRWCIAHRRVVIVGWVVLAIGITVIASAVGRQYANDFSLPNTESQHVVDLLKSEFPAQGGDVDQIVFNTTTGNVQSPAVRNAIEPLLTKVETMPHVASVTSPYTPAGKYESPRTAAPRSPRSPTPSARTYCPTTPPSRCSMRSTGSTSRA